MLKRLVTVLCPHLIFFLRDLLELTLAGQAQQTQSALLKLSNLETVPYTQNSHYYIATRDKWLAHYRQRRRDQEGNGVRYSRGQSVLESQEEAFETLKKQLAKFNISCSSQQDLWRFLEPDKYDEALQVMAATQAYLKVRRFSIYVFAEILMKISSQVAFKVEKTLNLLSVLRLIDMHLIQRAIDIYPRAVDENLLQPLAEAAYGDVINFFKIYEQGAEQRCQELLAETPAKRHKRELLQARIEMLTKVKRKLDEYSGMSRSVHRN